MSRISNASTETALASDHVLYNILVYLNFASGSLRLHMGIGNITVDGQTWSGMGEFASITSVSERPDGRDYSNLTLGLNGIDATLLAKVPDRDEYIGRAAAVYVVAFNPDTYAPIEPIEAALFEGFMDIMAYERVQGGANISLTIKHIDALYAESIGLTNSDEHHQTLFSGDLICNLIPAAQDTEIVWGGSRVATGIKDLIASVRNHGIGQAARRVIGH